MLVRTQDGAVGHQLVHGDGRAGGVKGYREQSPEKWAYEYDPILRPRTQRNVPPLETIGVELLGQILVRICAHEDWACLVEANLGPIDDGLEDFLDDGDVVVCFEEGTEAVRGFGAEFDIGEDRLETV